MSIKSGDQLTVLYSEQSKHDIFKLQIRRKSSESSLCGFYLNRNKQYNLSTTVRQKELIKQEQQQRDIFIKAKIVSIFNGRSQSKLNSQNQNNDKQPDIDKIINISKQQCINSTDNMSKLPSSLLNHEIRQRINQTKQEYLINKGSRYDTGVDHSNIESQILQEFRIRDRKKHSHIVHNSIPIHKSQNDSSYLNNNPELQASNDAELQANNSQNSSSRYVQKNDIRHIDSPTNINNDQKQMYMRKMSFKLKKKLISDYQGRKLSQIKTVDESKYLEQVNKEINKLKERKKKNEEHVTRLQNLKNNIVFKKFMSKYRQDQNYKMYIMKLGDKPRNRHNNRIRQNSIISKFRQNQDTRNQLFQKIEQQQLKQLMWIQEEQIKSIAKNQYLKSRLYKLQPQQQLDQNIINQFQMLENKMDTKKMIKVLKIKQRLKSMNIITGSIASMGMESNEQPQKILEFHSNLNKNNIPIREHVVYKNRLDNMINNLKKTRDKLKTRNIALNLQGENGSMNSCENGIYFKRLIVNSVYDKIHKNNSCINTVRCKNSLKRNQSKSQIWQGTIKKQEQTNDIFLQNQQKGQQQQKEGLGCYKSNSSELSKMKKSGNNKRIGDMCGFWVNSEGVNNRNNNYQILTPQQSGQKKKGHLDQYYMKPGQLKLRTRLQPYSCSSRQSKKIEIQDFRCPELVNKK